MSFAADYVSFGSMDGKTLSAGKYIPYTPSSDVNAGSVVVLGTLVAYAPLAIAANVEGNLQTEGAIEIYKSDKTTTYSVGDAVYWDATTQGTTGATKTVGSNKQIGWCIADSANGDYGVNILLRSMLSAATVAAAIAATTADGAPSIPLMLRKAAARTGSGNVTIGQFAQKVRIVDAWIVTKDTNTETVTVKQGSTTISSAMAASGTAGGVTRTTALVDAAQDLADATDLVATFSGTGSVEVFVLAIPST